MELEPGSEWDDLLEEMASPVLLQLSLGRGIWAENEPKLGRGIWAENEPKLTPNRTKMMLPGGLPVAQKAYFIGVCVYGFLFYVLQKLVLVHLSRVTSDEGCRIQVQHGYCGIEDFSPTSRTYRNKGKPQRSNTLQQSGTSGTHFFYKAYVYGTSKTAQFRASAVQGIYTLDHEYF